MSGLPKDLNALLNGAHVWRGRTNTAVRTQSTGYSGLDELLPGRGWPVGAITEVMTAHLGCGELQLVQPWLQRLTSAGGRAALLRPPLLPYAPGLAQAGIVLSRMVVVSPGDEAAAQWACEQMLRSGGFSAVLAWPGALSRQGLRKLQLAAEAGDACGVLYRNLHALSESSPSALRLELHGNMPDLAVTVHKCRGGRSGQKWQQTP